MLPSVLAFLIADSRLTFLFSRDQYCFPWISQFFTNDIIPTKEEGKVESLTMIQLFLQKEEALPGMYRGNIMRGDGGK